jgi:hypothetical protein
MKNALMKYVGHFLCVNFSTCNTATYKFILKFIQENFNIQKVI